GGRRIPALPGIHHEVAVRADGLAGRLDVREVDGLVLAERSPAELDRGEAQVDRLPGQLGGLAGLGAEEVAGVGPHILAMDAAEQLINRLAEGLAPEVPQGDV